MDYLSEFPNSNIVDVPDATKAYRIIDGMRRRGYSEEDITLYTIHQSFKNKCAEWSIIRENHDIWRLTDAASKIKKSEYKKIKKQ